MCQILRLSLQMTSLPEHNLPSFYAQGLCLATQQFSNGHLSPSTTPFQPGCPWEQYRFPIWVCSVAVGQRKHLFSNIFTTSSQNISRMPRSALQIDKVLWPSRTVFERLQSSAGQCKSHYLHLRHVTLSHWTLGERTNMCAVARLWFSRTFVEPYETFVKTFALWIRRCLVGIDKKSAHWILFWFDVEVAVCSFTSLGAVLVSVRKIGKNYFVFICSGGFSSVLSSRHVLIWL